MIRDEYAKVGVPMLPVVAGNVAATRQIWVYSLLLIPSTFLLIYPLAVSGIVYACIAFILGAIFITKAWALLQNPDDKQQARSLFLYSIFYMMLLCAGMVIDSLPLTHRLMGAILDFKF